MAWLASERAIQTLVGGVVSVVVVRYLGPSRFGTYSYAMAVVVLVSSLAQLNAGFIVREMAAGIEVEPLLVGSSVVVTAALVAVCAGAVICMAIVVPAHGDERSLILIFACGMLANPILVLDFVFQSRLGAKYATTARNLAALVTAAAIGLCIWERWNIKALAGATVVGPFVTAALYLAFYRRLGETPRRWRVSTRQMRDIVRRSAPLTVAGAAIAIYMRIDQLMLAWLSTQHQVGIYAATVRLSEFAYFIPMIVVASLRPGLAKDHAYNQTIYIRRLQDAYVGLGILAIAGIAATEILAARVVTAMFGAAFSDAAAVLRVHIIAAFFVFVGVIDSVWLVNAGLERYALIRTSCGAVVNVILNLILLPRFGAVGAAWATVVAYAIAATGADACNPKTRHLAMMHLRIVSPRLVGSLWRRLLKPVSA